MNSARAGTGWSSAVGVVATTRDGKRWSPKVASDRVARSFDSTVSRSLDAVKASRWSRLSASDSGNTRTSSGRVSSAAA